MTCSMNHVKLNQTKLSRAAMETQRWTLGYDWCCIRKVVRSTEWPGRENRKHTLLLQVTWWSTRSWWRKTIVTSADICCFSLCLTPCSHVRPRRSSNVKNLILLPRLTSPHPPATSTNHLRGGGAWGSSHPVRTECWLSRGLWLDAAWRRKDIGLFVQQLSVIISSYCVCQGWGLLVLNCDHLFCHIIFSSSAQRNRCESSTSLKPIISNSSTPIGCQPAEEQEDTTKTSVTGLVK